MRTTLDIDLDVLQAAKERARRENRTTGQVMSDLARRGLNAPAKTAGGAAEPSRYGFRPFPKRGGIVTNELIDALREDDAY
ncbi:MAG: antitoxin [Proteobacteria bacterium]|nr:antitoxin [Pseudomonadota bacterium]